MPLVQSEPTRAVSWEEYGERLDAAPDEDVPSQAPIPAPAPPAKAWWEDDGDEFPEAANPEPPASAANLWDEPVPGGRSPQASPTAPARGAGLDNYDESLGERKTPEQDPHGEVDLPDGAEDIDDMLRDYLEEQFPTNRPPQGKPPAGGKR